MRLCISNIAWEQALDEYIYGVCHDNGYEGIEIAPTRVFTEDPYEHIKEAQIWSKGLKEDYGLKVYSCQSIWYGRKEKIFGDKEERNSLLEYSKKAFEFAAAVGATNIVFGCPKNRNGYRKDPETNNPLAVDFFWRLAEYAARSNVTISMEANPIVYGTDFLNSTEETAEFVKRIGHPSFKLNLDIGTMLYYHENPSIVKNYSDIIGHVHISEPNLMQIQERAEHSVLINYLIKIHFDKAVSIEMRRQDNPENIVKTMKYAYSVIKRS